MKSYLPFIVILFIASNAYSEVIQIVNTDFLGSSADQPITFLGTNHKNSHATKSISVDIESGCYSAATVVYSELLTISKVKQALNHKYQKYESKITRGKPLAGLWRNQDKKFAIQITTDDDGDILVLYVRFRGKGITSCKQGKSI